MSMGTFVQAWCKQKGHWCNGKHIPILKTIGKYSDGRFKFGEDINKANDKESCEHYINNRCQHPRNPKNDTPTPLF